jgi:hypothetical protein
VLYLNISSSDMSVTENILQTLSMHRRRVWLFPKLQSISWDIADDVCFPYVSLFLHPGINKVNLYLDVRTSQENVHDALRILETACPALNALDISHFDSWDDDDDGYENLHMSQDKVTAMSDDLSHLVMHSPSLTSVIIPHRQLTLSVDAIKHLAQAPNLQVLRLRKGKLDVISGNRDQRVKKVLFPRLRDIAVEVEEPTTLLGILRQTGTAFLKRLAITSKSLITGAQFSLISPEIIRCGATSLTSLSLAFDSPHAVQPPGQEDRYRLTSAILQPLLALSKIQYISISSPYIEPDDRLLSLITQAWPDLGNLRFVPALKPISEIITQTPLVTLDGVYALIRGCPKLVALDIAIDTSTPLSPNLPALPLRGAGIYLDFFWSKPDAANVHIMATGLQRIHKGRHNLTGSDPWAHYDTTASVQTAGIDVAAYAEYVHTCDYFWKGIEGALNKKFEEALQRALDLQATC